MKLSVSAYRAHASAHKKILSSSYQHQLNYGSTAPAPAPCPLPQFTVEEPERRLGNDNDPGGDQGSSEEPGTGSLVQSLATSRDEDDDSSNNASSEGKSPGQRRRIRREGGKSPAKEKLIGCVEDVTRGYGTDRSPPNPEGPNRRMSSAQNWKNVRAVMAYYYSLRKIKRTKSNQRWMKLRTTVQLSSAISTIQKKPPLKREDSFLKRFSTRQIPETQETVEDTGSEGGGGGGGSGAGGALPSRRRRRAPRPPRTVVNPDENFYFYWLWLLTGCVLYNLWTLIVRQSFPELQALASTFWFACDTFTDIVFAADLAVQLRTGYLEQGLMVYDARKLAGHYLNSRAFLLDLLSLTPLDLLQLRFGPNPMLRFPRFLKVYRAVNCYYIVESRTVYPNFWRVINLIHILLILAHWFGCFYFLLSEAEGFQGDWVYPHRPGDYATLTRKYLGSLYWSTLTLTTIGDLPTPETNAEASQSADGPKSLPRRGLKSRLLQFRSNGGYVFTIVSYLIGVFIFATIVGQVGNVITNRNANRLEFERLLDGAKTYMRHHKVPGGMKRRVLRWYDYSWSRGRIQGGGDINTALGLLPDKLKTELALHVNLSVLKKVTIFQECQPEFLHDLVLKMKAYIFTPGDSICRKGEVAREMFIIADGILEVISETGHVLTTMKAGDFFGEIGILNLDGLNKRTADVRSVGYSELFSLSREDVLAAMKDYPEAQEILQTLGRKRLQEARSVSRKAKGETDDKMDGDDNSAPKRIVHRIRSDVKGIRNALRNRSRPSRRSVNGETLELRCLNSNPTGAQSGVVPKGVLRRMPRVESDEIHHAEDEVSGSAEPSSATKEEKVTSPLGAGLPLLARLKLLKERQEREEKEATKLRGLTIPQVSTPPQPTPSTSTPSEPEVIGAGLPLLQRLLLLKAKEDREKSLMGPSTSGVGKATLNSNPPSSTDTISPCSLKSPLSPTIKTLSPLQKSSGSNSPGKSISPTIKPSRKNSSGSSDSSSKPKVSFKDKIMKLQEDGTSVSQPLSQEEDTRERKFKSSDKLSAVLKSEKHSNFPIDPKLIPQTISIPTSVVNKMKSPAKAVGTTFKDKLKLLQSAQTSQKETLVTNTVPNKFEIPPSIKTNLDSNVSKTDTENKAGEKNIKGKICIDSKKPWSKLKEAAILGDSRESSSSRQGSLNSDSFKEKSCQPLNVMESAKIDTSAKNAALSKIDLVKNTQSSVTSFETIMPSHSSSDINSDNKIGIDNKIKDLGNLDDSEKSRIYSCKDQTISQESISNEIENIMGNKNYDLRQETKKQLTSRGKPIIFSLSRKNKSYVSVEDLSPEYGMLPFVKKLKILNERQKLAELENEVKKARSSSLDYGDTQFDTDVLTRSNSEGSTMGRHSYNSNQDDINFQQHIDDSQNLLSPESNETMERRNLKSILKKLSEDAQMQETPLFKKLIRAPTLEGYAARHSKFSKSVTFNRDTLTSPPSSGTEQKSLFPISNPYQRLNDRQSTDSPEKFDTDDAWICDEQSITNTPSVNENRSGMERRDSGSLGIDKSSNINNMVIEKRPNDFDPLDGSLDQKFKFTSPSLEGLHPEQIRVPKEKPKLSLISAVANQRKIFRGSLEEQEYFGEVLLGIKHVIQGHLHEVQGKFQERFNNLELEVKRRDEIISQLQSRIQELERIGLTSTGGTFQLTPTTYSRLHRVNSLETDDKTMSEDIISRETDTVSGLTASSGSDEMSLDQGFMRGDSLDTVFTSSPPNASIPEEVNEFSNASHSECLSTQNPEDIENFNALASQLDTHFDFQSEIAEKLLRRELKGKSKQTDSKLDRPMVSYSRQKATKLKQRRSWEESSDQENMELQELPRSLSPQNFTCEERTLLSPTSRSSIRQKRTSQPFHLFGSHLDSTKGKIKKTSSVDTGIHHTGIKNGASTAPDHEHRKFSLGSFFGYHKGGHSKQSGGLIIPRVRRHTQHGDSIILDMGSEAGSSDGNSSSSSTSSGDSDYVPRAPAFEQFHARRDSGSSSLSSSKGRSTSSKGSGGDWEVLMLAEELDRRERDEARKARGNQPRRSGEPPMLRSLEEESDTPSTPQHQGLDFIEVEDLPHHSESISSYSPHPLHKTGSFSGPSSSIADWLQRRSRGLILRASSLEHPEPSRSTSNIPGRLDSNKSSSTDGHKKL